MKNLKGLFAKVVLLGSMFVGGYIANELQKETPVQAQSQIVETVNNNVKQGLNEIESNERNVFTQYFTITAIDEKGVDVVNQYNENDNYYIDKQDFNLDFDMLKIGTKIAVTFDHDTTISADLDYRYIHQYKLVDAQQFNVDIDEDKYILGINNMYPSDTVILNKYDSINVGDLVNVTFENENGDSIKQIDTIGKWKEIVNDDKAYQDSFDENAKTDPNRNNPNYEQVEDGSYMPK